MQADILPCLSSQPLSTLLSPAFPGCTIGDKLFSDFSAQTAGTLGNIDATLVNVLTSISPTGEFILEFTGGLTAAGGANGGVLDEAIGYHVSTLSGAALIDDLVLGVGPLQDVGAGPDSATVDEFACIGLNVRCTGSNANFTLSAIPGNTPSSLKITFAPVSSLSVTKTVKLDAAAGNTVTLQSLTNGVSQVTSSVPEPGTMVLLGIALLFLAKIGRRKLAN